MDFKQYLELVKAMRDMQNEYFKTRSKTALMKAKKLEKEVDEQTLRCLASNSILVNKTPNPGFIW